MIARPNSGKVCCEFRALSDCTERVSAFGFSKIISLWGVGRVFATEMQIPYRGNFTEK